MTHLLEGYTSTPHDSVSSTGPKDATPSVFIVAPPTQATSSIQRIYTKLNTRLLRDQQSSKQGSSKTPSRPSQASGTTIDTQTKSLLTNLSLLQYLDIAGLTESISEILTIIAQRQSQSQQQQRTILLIQGLPQTLTTTHRRTGTLQTAALLSSLLQSLRNITRVSGGTCLVLLEMDVAWGGGVSNNTTTTTTHSVPSPNNVSPGPTLPSLKSAFSSRSGKSLRVVSGAVFGRVLEEGVDVFVVLHDGEGRIGRGKGGRVVECVRDERGLGYGDGDGAGADGEDAFGSWTIWG